MPHDPLKASEPSAPAPPPPEPKPLAPCGRSRLQRLVCGPMAVGPYCSPQFWHLCNVKD